MNIKYRIVLLMLICLFICLAVSAKGTRKETFPDNEQLEYTLPEVIVKGDNSMRALKKEVIKAEELKFEVFNNLNSTDDFDITCEWRTPTGTRMQQWSCEVEYMRKAKEEAVRDMLDHGVSVYISAHSLAIKHADKTRALNNEMKALAIRHPELALAMINAHEMQEFYKNERKRRYKKSIFVGEPPDPDLKLNKLVIWEAAFKDHRNGVITDSTWARWDSMYKKLFSIRSYRTLWKKADHKQFGSDFVAYVNAVVLGK